MSSGSFSIYQDSLRIPYYLHSFLSLYLSIHLGLVRVRKMEYRTTRFHHLRYPSKTLDLKQAYVFIFSY